MNELVKYVKTVLKQGISESEIRQRLFTAGYTQEQVSLAFRQIKHSKLKKVLLITVIFSLIVSAGFFITSFFMQEEVFLEIRAIPSAGTIQVREPVTIFMKLMANTKKKLIVLLNTSILYKTERSFEDQKEITFKGSVEQNLTFNVFDREGRYLIRFAAYYDNAVTGTDVPIKVVKNITALPYIIEEECPVSCEDFNVCTADFCERGVCVNEPVVPCCGNHICESGETIESCPLDCVKKKVKRPEEEIVETAKKIAQMDIEKASLECNTIVQEEKRDNCFKETALSSKKSAFCEAIINPSRRDDCFISFSFIEEKRFYCTKIQDAILRDSCNRIEALESIRLPEQV